MHKTVKLNRAFFTITRIAAICLFGSGVTLGLQAQQPQAADSQDKVLDLRASLTAPLDLPAPSDLNYSSSVGAAETEAAERFNLSGREDQPPPRRSYGRRPNYNDSWHNSDGSNKYTVVVGGGFTLPTGGTHNYATTSWKFQVGGGRNFNKRFGVLLQFDYDRFGMQTSTLNQQLALYNSLGAGLTQLDGYVKDWSFTLNPVYNVYQSDAVGAYVVVGLGFYHKYTSFTTPVTATCFDPFFGYYLCSANARVDWYTSNAFGVNGGIGFTYRLSRFASERFYAEARYVWTNNQRRPYDVSGTTSYFNAFPQAGAPTTYIPVTFGIRF
ncbi:outer membrane beta-barrel protein [Edaphobacter bradus]|uniref:outer membrane beta-barrel protein n=1 Tax=Edaphobacter bradus TaxID=2259016 RepID=UPI0021E079FB|nr:outer membrane beta-barrel protein [Edaphobacter bradus]